MPETVQIHGDSVVQVKDPVEALTMLARTTMRPFTKEDWYAYAGCESKEPMIGEFDDKFQIVLDGDLLSVFHSEDMYGGTIFKLYLQ